MLQDSVSVNSTPSLTELQLQPEYRSDGHDLVADFYVPCLSRSTLYRRAVGFFTSRGLSVAAQGISALIDGGGSMRLVASPRFEIEDVEAIENGYAARDSVLAQALTRELDAVSSSAEQDRLAYLAWLIAHDRLDVRVAIAIDSRGRPRRGLYHEKLGVFSDATGNSVAFSGSSNETEGGLLENFEANDVFWSWEDPQGRVARKIEHFERLWSNRTSGLNVVEFPEAARRRLLEYQSQGGRPGTRRDDGLWTHQRNAVSAFLEVERGVIQMATGTGKTRTATHLCERLLSEEAVSSIIVATDGNDLLEQWYRELLQLVQRVGRPMSVHRHFGEHHENDRFQLDPSQAILLVSRPALAAAMQQLTPDEARRTFLVHDEVHRLGSPANRVALEGLSDHVRFRLGLSATPEREYDAVGNEFVESHIGPVVYEFGLDDAILGGILSPFDYHPIAYEPDEDDGNRIRQVYQKVAARKHAGNPMSKEEIWIDLARVYKTSRAKIPLFEEFIRHRRHLLERCVIFVETREYGEEVLRVVHEYRHGFHTYFSGEDSSTLERFARGELECLLTCHRLSEGIDIRSLTTVILFSSARARLETIQRMGRCLRRDPGRPDKRATVVDFIRASDPADTEEQENADQLRAEWLTRLSELEPVATSP